MTWSGVFIKFLSFVGFVFCHFVEGKKPIDNKKKYSTIKIVASILELIAIIL